MRPRLGFVCLLLLLNLAPRLSAQRSPAVRVALGGGAAFGSVGDFGYSRGTGATGFVRVVKSVTARAAVGAELWVRHFARPNVVFPPCIAPGCVGLGGEIGPTTALTLAPLVELQEGSGSTVLLYHLGPSVDWLPERRPGTRAVVPGVRGGVALRLGPAGGGFLLSADAIRAFNADGEPGWTFPVTAGWEF